MNYNIKHSFQLEKDVCSVDTYNVQHTVILLLLSLY